MSLQQCNYIWNKKSQENLSLSLPPKPDLCVTSDSQILVILHLSHAKTPLQYKHWVVFRAGIQQRAQFSYLLQWISLLGWLLNIPVLLLVRHWVSIWSWEIKEESASLSAKWPKRTALIAATMPRRVTAHLSPPAGTAETAGSCQLWGSSWWTTPGGQQPPAEGLVVLVGGVKDSCSVLTSGSGWIRDYRNCRIMSTVELDYCCVFCFVFFVSFFMAQVGRAPIHWASGTPATRQTLSSEAFLRSCTMVV